MIALITGASGGIGEELARIFTARRQDVVLVARGREKLEALSRELSTAHGVQAHVLAADLTDPACPGEVFRTVEEQGLTIDVLVNNAGFGARGAFADLDYEVQGRMIQLNITTLTHLTRLFLPGMLERRTGKILNVASTAAFFPGPLMAVYYASKAYVVSFSEALAEEVRGTGVTVTALCPGATKTNFANVAGNAHSPLFKNAMDAQAVALAGYDGLMAGERMVVPGSSNKMTVFSSRLAPRAMLAKITRKLNS
ncbi:MAG: SDR family oxidoreductase [Bryobacteraceae bacterium]